MLGVTTKAKSLAGHMDLVIFAKTSDVGRGVVSGACGWKILSIQRPEQPHPRIPCLLLCTGRRCASLGRKNSTYNIILSTCTCRNFNGNTNIVLRSLALHRETLPEYFNFQSAGLTDYPSVPLEKGYTPKPLIPANAKIIHSTFEGTFWILFYTC